MAQFDTLPNVSLRRVKTIPTIQLNLRSYQISFGVNRMKDTIYKVTVNSLSG